MTDIFSDDRNRQDDRALRSLGPIAVPRPDRVTSVAVVPIDVDSGLMLAVVLTDRGIDIPGGHTQRSDATSEDTARRECLEEAGIELGALWLVDVVESDYYGSSPRELTYMLIFGAEISRLLPFTPSSESTAREAMEPSRFLDRYTAGDKDLMESWVRAAFTRVRARTN